jgi:hypothetical protein
MGRKQVIAKNSSCEAADDWLSLQLACAEDGREKTGSSTVNRGD